MGKQLASENTPKETKLALRYEDIRRKEYELISDLLEILPKIDMVDEERVAQVRDALFHADHPFLMVFVGPFSSGKSSLINALLGSEDVLRVGPTPTTDRINILRYGEEASRMDSGGEVDTVFYPSEMLKKVSFVDTPGLESIFKKHEETTRKFLHRSDVVLLTMLATQAMSQRNLDYLQQLREYGKKVIIIINQCDLLSEEEREQVREYVQNQSQDKLGYKPDIWMMSARQGIAAQRARGGAKVVVMPEDGSMPTDSDESPAIPETPLLVVEAEAEATAAGSTLPTPPSTPALDTDTPPATDAPAAVDESGNAVAEKVVTNANKEVITAEELWDRSGMAQLENYINRQLGDVDRLRQKLQTPLNIAQNVHRVALDAVKSNQAVLDQYQGIAENVQQQLAAYQREQERIVREINDEITNHFNEAADRGEEAIRETFQLSNAVGAVGRGFTDLIGLGRLFRRGKKSSYARLAFERHKVYEPLGKLTDATNKLGPRLEGKDLQDIDDLVKYAQGEIDALPSEIRGKVIGKVQPPLKYDRTMFTDVRPKLEDLEERARKSETDKLEGNLRSTFFGLAVWEAVLLLIAIIVGIAGELTPVVIIVLLVAALVGIFATPLLGRFLATGYRNQMLTVQQEYIDTLTKAADKQIDYGMRLRRDVVAPLTRLVETQTSIQTEQMTKLQKISQGMTEIEGELTKLGKRGLFGLGG